MPRKKKESEEIVETTEIEEPVEVTEAVTEFKEIEPFTIVATAPVYRGRLDVYEYPSSTAKLVDRIRAEAFPYTFTPLSDELGWGSPVVYNEGAAWLRVKPAERLGKDVGYILFGHFKYDEKQFGRYEPYEVESYEAVESDDE